MIFYFLIGLFIFNSPDSDRLKPPGTIQVAENLFVDQTEITLIDWREFEYYTLSEEANRINSNSGIVNRVNDKNIPDTSDRPLDHLSYEEALTYCQWRTDRINEGYLSEEDYLIVYRLPTEREFKLMIEHEKAPFKKRLGLISNQIAETNPNGGIEKFYSYGTRKNGKFKRTRGYKKNGIFGLFSNAAEMSSEKGIAFGMTNQNFDPDGDPLIQTTYNGPSKWVGFRCVAEYVKK